MALLGEVLFPAGWVGEAVHSVVFRVTTLVPVGSSLCTGLLPLWPVLTGHTLRRRLGREVMGAGGWAAEEGAEEVVPGARGFVDRELPVPRILQGGVPTTSSHGSCAAPSQSVPARAQCFKSKRVPSFVPCLREAAWLLHGVGELGDEGLRQGVSARDRQSLTCKLTLPAAVRCRPSGMHWLPVPGRWSVPSSDLQNMATCLRRLARMLWTLLLVSGHLCMCEGGGDG